MPDRKPSIFQAYKIFFIIIACAAGVVLLLVVLSRSQAGNLNQTVTVSNASPTTDTVITAITTGGTDQSTITPTENSTKTLYIRGAATDNNGCEDVNTASQWTLKIYRTDKTSSCSADNNDCYAGDTANLTFTNCSGAGDVSLDYEWTLPIQYYADATDAGSPNSATNWTASVTAKDDSNATGSNTDTFEMVSLIALSVTSSTDYGTVALGADSAQQTITFTNTGNSALDADQTAGGDMTCTVQGTIAVGQAHISATNGFTYGTSDQALTAGATNVNLTLAQRTSESTPSTVNWYAKLRMPSTGVGGACTNTVTFTAKADA